MHDIFLELEQLTDGQLRRRLDELARGERSVTAALIAHLAEFDARRIYLGDGYSSLFAWCTGALHLSEHAAYLRIEAARAARRFPLILEQLADGAVHLTAVSLLAPHLTGENHRDLLDAARHRSKRDIEEMVAALRRPAAAPAARARIVPLPVAARNGTVDRSTGLALFEPGARAEAQVVAPAAGSESAAAAAAAAPATAAPCLSITPATTYRLHVTIPRRTLDRLERARELMRHQIPGGDTASILDRALELLVDHLERRKFAALKRG